MAGAFSQLGPLVRLSEMSDRNRTCQPGKVTSQPDIQPGSTTRQTPFSGRGDVPLSGHTVNKFRRSANLQLNIEGLTASKMNLLHHLAVQYETLVILFQETHCTCADKPATPGFALAGSSLSRKHGLATFVHDRIKWTLVDQLPTTSENEWLCVDVDGYRIVKSTNVHLRDCKPLISQCFLTPFSVLAILIVGLSTGVIEPAVPMKSSLLLGQVLSLSTTQRTWPPFILAALTLAPNLI